MKKIEINEDELLLLARYVETSPVALIRLKAQAVLMRTEGMKLASIARIVSRSKRTVGGWLTDWSARRMASVFSGHVNNENAAKLTKQQKQEIKEALLKPPSENDIPREFWDVPAIREYVDATFGIIYESPRSYHFLLRFGNLSFKYPDMFDRRRDEVAIEKRMKGIRHEIKPLLHDASWEVFASDEVRMQLEALTRRAWLRRGERTIVKVNRKREAQNYIGFLNQKSFSCRLYELAWQNQKEILKILEPLMRRYPKKKICIIWDNAKFHKGALIREALRKGGILERVHLINFPPYAPDHNPIEHVWNGAKGSIANIQRDIFSETKEAFQNFVSSRKFHYQI